MGDEIFARMRNEGGGFAEIDDEVADVLAFVISHTMFLAAQDAKWDDARKFAMAGFPPYRQPSPRGEGAPQGRIGHWRHASEREGVSQAGDL